jgi:hypothetical protein
VVASTAHARIKCSFNYIGVRDFILTGAPFTFFFRVVLYRSASGGIRLRLFPAAIAAILATPSPIQESDIG